jgi:hypothetical protein
VILLVAILAASSAVESYRPVERRDWVEDYDRWTTHKVKVFGKKVEMPMPAKDAHRVLVASSDYDKLVAEGRRERMAALEARPPLLARAEASIKLRPFELKSFWVEEGTVRVLEQSGDAAEIFWTTPRADGERRYSKVYFLARHPGSGAARVTPEAGEPRILSIEVADATP